MKGKNIPLICCILFSLCAGLFVHVLAYNLPAQLTDMKLCDTWFGADIPRRFEALTSRYSANADSFKHPFFHFLYFPAKIISSVIQEPRNSINLMLSANAFVWASLCWYILFSITHRMLDSTLYGFLILSTAAGVLWLPVIETYAFGSTSILVPLAVLVTAGLRKRPLAHALSFVASASLTVTNAMFSIIAMLLSLKTKKIALSIGVGTAIILFGSVIQNYVFPSGGMVLSPRSVTADFSLFATINRPVNIYLREFAIEPLIPNSVYAGIVPKHYTQVRKDFFWPENNLLAIGTHPGLPNVDYQVIYQPNFWLLTSAIACWLVILAGGTIASVTSKESLPLRIAISAGILGQFILHYIYGAETTIYALHWMPLLVFFAAFSSRSGMRKYMLAATAVLVPLALYSNIGLYLALVRYVSGVEAGNL